MSTASPRLFACVALLISAIAQAQTAPTARDLINTGVTAFKQTHYAEAARYFRQAVAADPQSVQAHLYLGSAIFSQYIPAMDSPDQVRFADEARAEFETVLTLDPSNVLAASNIASLYYNQTKYDEAAEWNRKVIALDPNNKEAYYTLGVIAWTKWLPVDRQARADSNQKAEDAGPLANAATRERLKSIWMPVLDDGISNLLKALEIEPQYDDAMAYMNLLIRYRADLLDTPEEWNAASSQANEWMQESLDSKRLKANGPAPLPPPPPPTASGQLRVSAEVLSANLLNRVDPVYPPLARRARISGTVRFSVTVGVDGLVKNLQLISGHPLLVAPAKEAVFQYTYKPTLLNGNPVDVVSTVEVLFVNP